MANSLEAPSIKRPVSSISGCDTSTFRWASATVSLAKSSLSLSARSLHSPKSRSPTFPSGIHRTLPGWGSEWNRPSTKICWPNASSRRVKNTVPSKEGGMFSRGISISCPMEVPLRKCMVMIFSPQSSRMTCGTTTWSMPALTRDPEMASSSRSSRVKSNSCGTCSRYSRSTDTWSKLTLRPRPSIIREKLSIVFMSPYIRCSMPLCWTLITMSSLSSVRARCTWAMVAVARGSVSTLRYTSSSFLLSCPSTVPRISLNAACGHASNTRLRRAVYCGGRRSALEANTCPTLG
mmetsp:Transcript_34057/g.108208  ORF Transcript_34057/g.108208 Transcript_34057/m.108208 type:complete len:292 (+) Transcript_34057:852-1727(+)